MKGLVDIYLEWVNIKKEVPSYRLGQHYCNALELKDTFVDGVDLFLVESPALADKLMYSLSEQYQWDVCDVPYKQEKHNET